MKPYPLAALNHLTLPSGITNLLLRKQPRSGCRVFSDRARCPAKATRLRPSRSRFMQELCQTIRQAGNSVKVTRRIFRGLLADPRWDACRPERLAKRGSLPANENAKTRKE